MNTNFERWPITRVTSRSANPRSHTPAQIALIAASIKEFGWTNPVLGADQELVRAHGPSRRARFRSKRKEG